MHQTKVVTNTRNNRVGVLEVVKVYTYCGDRVVLQVRIKIWKEQNNLFFRHKKMQYLKMEKLYFCEHVVCYTALDGLIRGNNANILYSFFIS
jgi:NCAIR mutase (PurE)-related protein